MSRPIGPQTKVRFGPDERAWLDEQAQALGVPMAEVVRAIVKQAKLDDERREQGR